MAVGSLESSLLKYSAKEYFLRAALCHLCVDVLNAQHAIERYQEQYPAFQDSREYKFIKVWNYMHRMYLILYIFPHKRIINSLKSFFQSLIENLEEQNIENYTEVVKEYDSISRLDQWYTTMLLRIKKQINDNPDLR